MKLSSRRSFLLVPKRSHCWPSALPRTWNSLRILSVLPPYAAVTCTRSGTTSPGRSRRSHAPHSPSNSSAGSLQLALFCVPSVAIWRSRRWTGRSEVTPADDV